jgi:hypothetical protein
MWGNARAVNWPDIPWRRSAAQFLLEAGLTPAEGVCPSVTARIARECQKLDDVVFALRDEVASQPVRRSTGTPASHWWFWVAEKAGSAAAADAAAAAATADAAADADAMDVDTSHCGAEEEEEEEEAMTQFNAADFIDVF